MHRSVFAIIMGLSQTTRGRSRVHLNLQIAGLSFTTRLISTVKSPPLMTISPIPSSQVMKRGFSIALALAPSSLPSPYTERLILVCRHLTTVPPISSSQVMKFCCSVRIALALALALLLALAFLLLPIHGKANPGMPTDPRMTVHSLRS